MSEIPFSERLCNNWILLPNMVNLISQPTLGRIFLQIEFKFIGQDPAAGNKQVNRENGEKNAR